VAASVTTGRAARATPGAPRAASYTTRWDTAYFRVADGYFAADHTSFWGAKIG